MISLSAAFILITLLFHYNEAFYLMYTKFYKKQEKLRQLNETKAADELKKKHVRASIRERTISEYS